MADNSERICFVIAPIGERGTNIRKRSDQVLKHIIRPAVESCGYKAVRADEIAEPGIITNQIIRHVVDDPLVIADLTGQNPNVFYELAIRHATRKPLVQIIDNVEDIPFDVGSMRTIQVNHRDLDSVEEAKTEIKRQIQSLEKSSSSLETPISVVLEGRFIDESKMRNQRYIEEGFKEVGNKIDKIYRHINAKTATDEPEEAKQVAASAGENSINKAISQAVFLEQQGKTDEAIEKWRAVALVAEESDGELAAKAWYSVSYLFSDENQEGSLLASDEAIRLKPDFAEAYNIRGNAKAVLNRNEDAIADYDEAIQLESDYANAYYNRGTAKDELGQHEDAIADFDEAIRLKPNFFLAYNNRGNAKAALDQYEDAIADYDESVRLQPDFAEAYSNRGSVKVDLDRYEDAIADHDKAIGLKPDLSGFYNNRGNAKAERERYKDAIADYDEAIRLQPDDAEAYYNRGNVKADLGRYEDAISDYDEAIRLKPDYAEAYCNRGDAKADLDRYEDAIADYDEAVRLEPDDADAYCNRGDTKADLDRYEDAIVDYDEAIRLEPDDAEAYCNRGAAKDELGQHEDAIADYDEAIRLKPDFAEAYYNRGNAKAVLDRNDEAREDLETAFELAQNANDTDLVAEVKQLLRDLDADDT